MAKGRIYRHLQVLNHSDIDCAIRFVPWRYNEIIQSVKLYITHHMREIYGRPIYFKECETTDRKLEIDDIMKECGMSMGEIASSINTYMQKKVCFFRNQEDKRVPCELSRIREAYLATTENKAIEEIDNILYG